jgi:hypothetical protein
MIILIFLITPVFISAQDAGDDVPQPELDVEDLRRRIKGEPEQIMSFSLMDSEVSLFLTGSWKGTLQGNAGFSSNPLGTGFASPETPLLFTQEADLMMSLWINDRWFVEANFLDNSSMNTYRAGYQGLEGEYVQYAGIGNTGLDFPSFPYLDLGGDSPSSFGFYSRVGNGGLDVHALFRYDSSSRDEKVFVGGRERTYSYVNVQNSVRGISFVLPDTDIDSDIRVYIEDEKGDLTDSYGRRWRSALPSEYAAGRERGLLELTVRPGGMVAVAYSKNGNIQPWISSMGTYGGSPGEYLYEVQQWFGSINLENYPQPGGPSARPGEVTIGGVRALVIREPGTFSPFERRNRYDAPSNTSEQASVVYLSSGNMINGFDLVPLDTGVSFMDITQYTAVVTQRGMYELLPSRTDSPRDPQTLWPLAREYPEIYLPAVNVFTGDITLRFTNFAGTGAYFIGGDAVPGSIQVWRSGIQDANFSYNPSNGEVILSGPAGSGELIRVTYLRRSYESRPGSIAAGIGAVYHKRASPFSAMAALGIRWNLTEDSAFTEENASSPGSAGLGARASWDYDLFKASVTAGFALDQVDTTGLYRAAGMEGSETILALPPDASFLSNAPESSSSPSLFTGLDIYNRADLVYRNYTSTSVLGSTLMSVDWNSSTVVSGQNRPYPAKDPQLKDTNVLVAEFTLNGSKKWTGFQVPIFDSAILSRAGEIEIPYRLYGFSEDPGNDFQLIVQIGSLSGRDFEYTENPELVWEDVLFGNSQTFNTELRIARFSLTDEDRLKLADARFLRLIAVYSGSEEISGRVILAPPIVRGAEFRAVVFDGNTNTINGIPDFSSVNSVKALQTIDAGLESTYRDIIDRLHPSGGTQRVLKIEWENMQTGISAGVDGRVGELPLANYRVLSFFVKAPSAINSQTLSFIVSSGPSSIMERELEAHIPLSAFRAGQWSKVTIRYQGNDTGISVDGGDASGAWMRYRPKTETVETQNGKAGYIAILVNPDGPAPLDDAGISIDEIILEDPVMFYRMNWGASVQYSRPGTLLSIGGVSVLADFNVSSAVESEFRGEPFFGDGGIRGSMVNRTGAEISILGVKLTGNLLFTAGKDTFLWSADHGISRSWGPFSIGETFYASIGEKNAQHKFFIDYSSPLYARFNSDVIYNYSKVEQKWNLGAGFSAKNVFIPSINASFQAAWTGSTPSFDDQSYGKLWLKTWEDMIPDTGAGADNRKTSIRIGITERTSPVGAGVTLEGSTNYTGANSITALENSASLDIPVALKNMTLNFRAGRNFKRRLYFSGSDALQDGEKFFQSINDSLPLWAIFPGYSLFTEKLSEAMDSGISSSASFDIAQYTAFNDHFSARASLPVHYNLAAFFVPSSAGLRLERILEQKLDTRSDTFYLGGSLGYSAINMFGLMGYLPLFKFYQGDEYTHSLEAAFSFPKDENVSWRIQSSAGASFHGFSGGMLNLVNTLTFRSGGNWLESASLDWTVPAPNSLLGVFYKWIAETAQEQGSWFGLSSLLNSDYEQFRRESLELVLDKTENNFRISLSLGHESVVRILGRLNFSAFVKLRFSEDSLYKVYTFDVLLGTALRISF